MFFGRLTDVHLAAQYLMTLYFTFTTMTTVGYGDIHQVNPPERVLAIPFLLVSASVFGYMLATISSVMNSSSQSDSIASDKIALVTEYLKEKKCKKDLQDSIIYYFQRQLKEETGYDIDAITKKLPDYLANEIFLLFYQRKLNKIIFLDFIKNKSIALYLFKLLKPVFYEANQYVLIEDEEKNQNLYFVTTGQARIFKATLLLKWKLKQQKQAMSATSITNIAGTKAMKITKSLAFLNFNFFKRKTPGVEKVKKHAGIPADSSIDQAPSLDFTAIYPTQQQSYSSVPQTPEREEETGQTLHPDLRNSSSSGGSSSEDSTDNINVGIQLTTTHIAVPTVPSAFSPPTGFVAGSPGYSSNNGSSNRNHLPPSSPYSPGDSSASSRMSGFNPHRHHRKRRNKGESIVSKEDAVKMPDPVAEYCKMKRKLFVDLSVNDFEKIGYKFICDVNPTDFVGYSQFMKSPKLTSSSFAPHSPTSSPLSMGSAPASGGSKGKLKNSKLPVIPEGKENIDGSEGESDFSPGSSPLLKNRPQSVRKPPSNNTYSVKTSLETSFLVLEKSDLLSLVRTEPMIAMQLQTALAKSIFIQTNKTSKSLIYHGRKGFYHKLQRAFLTSTISGKRRNYNSSRWKKKQQQKEQEEAEKATGLSRYAPSTLKVESIKNLKFQRMFSTRYKKVQKISNTLLVDLEKQFREENTSIPLPEVPVVVPSAPKAIGKITSRQSLLSESHHGSVESNVSAKSTATRRASFIGNKSIVPRKRSSLLLTGSLSVIPLTSPSVSKLIRRSYSYNDLDYYLSPYYKMHTSYIRKESTSFSSFQVGTLDGSNLPFSHQNSSSSKLVGIVRTGSSGVMSSNDIAELTPTSRKRKSVTFQDDIFIEKKLDKVSPRSSSGARPPPPPPPPPRRTLSLRNPQSSTASGVERETEMVDMAKERENSEEDVKEGDPEERPSLRHDDFILRDVLDIKDEDIDELLRSPSLAVRDPSRGRSNPMDQFETRPRSYSFPFYGYHKWKLYNAQQYSL
jgi:hypothetical protein